MSYYPERHQSRKEAAISALRFVWPMMLIMFAIFLGLGIYGYMRLSYPESAIAIKMMAFFAVVGPLAMFFLLYRLERDQPTQSEVEEDERGIARRLLAKYPDLKSE